MNLVIMLPVKGRESDISFKFYHFESRELCFSPLPTNHLYHFRSFHFRYSHFRSSSTSTLVRSKWCFLKTAKCPHTGITKNKPNPKPNPDISTYLHFTKRHWKVLDQSYQNPNSQISDIGVANFLIWARNISVAACMRVDIYIAYSNTRLHLVSGNSHGIGGNKYIKINSWNMVDM